MGTDDNGGMPYGVIASDHQAAGNVPRALWWDEERGALAMIDQSALPIEFHVLTLTTATEVADAIRTLKVRGAPAIGVAAAFGFALGARAAMRETRDAATLRGRLDELAQMLVATRPTAVNLTWAVRRMRAAADSQLTADGADVNQISNVLFSEAQRIASEDASACRAMGELGAELIHDGDRLLTHCNAGALATAGMGTALAPIFVAHQAGKRLHVYVDETRPVLQGARLTAWELQRAGVPLTLITDSMAAHIIKRASVNGIFVGADRIAANGDVANKIGTYGLAVIAREHGVPFYVVAPRSTIDLTLPSGEAIPIEERSPEEVTHVRGQRIAPEGVAVANPAFDITPARFVAAIITEAGIIRPPYREGLREVMATHINASTAGTGGAHGK